MTIATQPSSYNTQHIAPSKRKQLALASIKKVKPLSTLAKENKVSRKFIYHQKEKALEAINDAFVPVQKEQEKVLFYLPVTLSWLCQLILCLLLHCRANHRGIQKLLQDAFDHDISLGSIHTIGLCRKVLARF